MFRIFRTVQRFKCWYRKNRNYARSRKQSDYRALSLAEQIVRSGSLQSARLTGSPLARGGE